MWRRSAVRWSWGDGRCNESRYTTATFHDGTHRVAPGDATPWRSHALSRPLAMLRTVCATPISHGLVVGLSCALAAVTMFTVQLQRDSRTLYKTNAILLRNLHAEQQRAESGELRIAQLRTALAAYTPAAVVGGDDGDAVAHTAAATAVPNYEVELQRERARVAASQERIQGMQDELRRVRYDLASVTRERDALRSAAVAVPASK